MEKKQTAIDWLFMELQELESKYAKSNFKISIEVYETTKRCLKEKAKDMEKEQHAITWLDSRIENHGDDYIGKEKSFDQYYAETYEKR